MSRSGKSETPSRASMVASAFELLTLLLITFAGFDYFHAFTPLYALGATGVIILQTGVAFATVKYFTQRKDPRLFRTKIAPAIAFIGFLISLIMIARNYAIFAGNDSLLINISPALYAIVFSIGFLRRKNHTQLSKVDA